MGTITKIALNTAPVSGGYLVTTQSGDLFNVVIATAGAATVYKYNKVDDSWASVGTSAFAGSAMRGKEVMVIGNKIYIYYNSNVTYFKHFDTTNNTFADLSPLNLGSMYRPLGLAINDKVYLGLGFASTASTSSVAEWWEYTPSLNTWVSKASAVGLANPTSANNSRCAHFTIGSMGYVVRTGTGALLNVYNQDTNVWSTKAAPPVTVNAAVDVWMIATAVGTTAYAALSSGNGSTGICSIYTYDSVVNTWNSSAYYPLSTTGASVVSGISVLNSELYICNIADTSSAKITYRLTAPTALTVATVDVNTARLTWTDNSTDEDSFIIERKRSDASVYTILATVGAGVLTYDDTTVDLAAYSYWYRVRAAKTS
jgi:hypothetical protein